MKDFNKCFALNQDGGCSILTRKLCEITGKCKFFKTQADFDKDAEKYKSKNIQLGLVDINGNYDIDNERRRKHFERLKEKKSDGLHITW